MLAVSNIINIAHLQCGPDPGCLILPARHCSRAGEAGGDTGCMDPDCIFIPWPRRGFQQLNSIASTWEAIQLHHFVLGRSRQGGQYQESSIQYRSADATKRIISKSLREKGGSYTINLGASRQPSHIHTPNPSNGKIKPK